MGGLDKRLQTEYGEPLSWALGIAAVAFAWGGFRVFSPLYYVSPDFIAVFLGFVLHEAAHKLVSIRMGMKSEFIAYGPGLLITFLSGLVPFIIVLAPGYVRSIYTSWMNPRGFLYSVIAGPATNIVLSLGALIIFYSLPQGLHGIAPFLAAIAEVNAWFAFFNLLPIPPLDGSKIVRATPVAWAAMFLVSVILVIL